MSHWAEIDSNKTVVRVLVGDNNSPDEGEEFMNSLGGTWVKTSYNATIRKNYAGIGYTYNSTLDAFIPPKPFASWVLDEAICQWNPPTPMPTDDKRYEWVEADLAWKEIVI